ncbi:MAG TPA: hypothetical protein VJB57_18275 [Dehalococcoidia bacterium]|nr:hypothetical protein [Dehalococcoidia bacterium]
MNTFVDSFMRWKVAHGTEKSELERQLVESYDVAWAQAKQDDKLAIIYFITFAKIEEGFGLVLEAINSPKLWLADQGMTCLLILAMDGINLGPNVLAAVRVFKENFPSKQDACEAIVRVFESKGWPLKL